MTVNSTTSELVQDNSLPECVSPETNPTDTIQNNELIFGQKHNIEDGEVDCEISQSTVITEDSMGRDHKTTITNDARQHRIFA